MSSVSDDFWLVRQVYLTTFWLVREVGLMNLVAASSGSGQFLVALAAGRWHYDSCVKDVFFLVQCQGYQCGNEYPVDKTCDLRIRHLKAPYRPDHQLTTDDLHLNGPLTRLPLS
ncbi:hypothetical protein TNCV_3160801 [Trichonephila clavipes]|nr:hypothetical protein TNCV_3160801 [Trichonephila clavipes]